MTLFRKYTSKLSALFIAGLTLLATGCQDDTFIDIWQDEYPEGISMVKVELDFEPLSSQTMASRSLPGKTMDSLDDFCIVAYDTDGNLMPGFPVEITEATHNLSVTGQQRNDADASNGASAENETRHATFDVALPNGRYYLYGLANIGTRSKDGKVVISTMTALQTGDLAEAVKTREGLLTYKAQWDEENPLNNFEMLGFFTNASESTPPSTHNGYNDVTVGIRNTGDKIHSWLRRCVAKITIDFDATNLRDNIYIYIKRATIHDIPRECSLGVPNAAKDRYELISYKDSPYFKDDGEYDTYEPTTGDMIDYTIYGNSGESEEHKRWPRISRGHPKLTDTNRNVIDLHAENAESMFMYENMQGESLEDERNKEQAVNEEDGTVVGAGVDEKDTMLCGSYIEVEGYYDIASSTEVSQGPIKYRFMLGKDALKNFDVERNYHLKITMCPRGNGNDVDWHIEYESNTGFEFRNPYYVSYLYNHSSALHFRYDPKKEGVTLVSLDAEIVGNNWWPDGAEKGGINEDEALTKAVSIQDPLWGPDEPGNPNPGVDEHLNPLKATFTRNVYKSSDVGATQSFVTDDMVGRNRYVGNGFLTLWANDNLNITVQDVTGETYSPQLVGHFRDNADPQGYYMGINDKYFFGKGITSTVDRGKRTYYTNGGQESSNRDEWYSITKDDNGYLCNLPVFTRAKNLIKQLAFTGNNPYEGATRSAYIRFTAHLSDGTTESQIIRVKQVPRLTNPKGIYRSGDNNESFNVTLVERESASGANFVAFESDGPWMAEILTEKGQDNFIRINGRKAISGGTGSQISFLVSFNKMLRGGEPRNAIIRVRYHNYTCVHLIMVRQGYDAVDIGTGTEWNTCNLIYKDVMAEDPRDEGSLFKADNLTQPIDVRSNEYPNTPFLPSLAAGTDNFTVPDKFYIARPDRGLPKDEDMKTWREITTRVVLADNPQLFNADSNVATMSDIQALFGLSQTGSSNIQHGFGVLYADGAKSVAMTVSDAFGYSRHDTSANAKSKGMRGVFVYYWDGKDTGGSMYNYRNIFFPIGRSGYGMRKAWESYMAMHEWGGPAHGGILRYATGREMPMSEASPDCNLYLPQFFDNYRRPGAVYWSREFLPGHQFMNADGVENLEDAATLDLNYYTFDVQALGMQSVHKHSQWWRCTEHPSCVNACFLRTVKKSRTEKAVAP